MTTEEILVHQVLHGYSNGHSLLAASRKLPREVERILLLLSDMSGPSMVRGFETYLTGFPLQDISVYALGRTWYAPEMKRPGCVWTHTLLIGEDDLTHITDLTVLLNLFKRPQKRKSRKEVYSSPIPISFGKLDFSVDQPSGSLQSLCLALTALYGEASKSVFIPADSIEEYEDLSLAIWSQQWPRLRYSFCFSTGSIANRQVDGKVFDLQVIPWKSIRKIKREVPSGVFLDFDDPNLLHDQSSWATAAAQDLLHIPPSGNLRRFLWSFGGEQRSGRAAFRKLVETNADFSAVNSGKLSLQGLIERIAGRFPSPEEATLLKASILGGGKPEESWLHPSISESELLRNLFKTEYYSAFDRKSLGIQHRAKCFWQASPSSVIELTLELLDSDLNPLGEEYIIGVAKSIGSADAREISRTSRTLLHIFVRHNPALAETPEVWRVSADEQRELFNSVSSGIDLDVDTMRNIVVAILESGSDSIASAVVSRFGDVAASAVLDWVDSCPSASFHMVGYGWRHALSSQPSVLFDWVRRSTVKTQFGVAFVASLLDPNSSEVIRAGAEAWLSLARNAAGNLEGDVLISTMSFLLALGFNNPGPGSHELVEHSFQIVHDSAQSDTLRYSNWRLVEKNVPHLAWWRDWDKCERLRRALVGRFIRYQWPIASFLRSIKSPTTFERIVDYCQRTREGRALIREAARCIASGTVRGDEYQKRLLSRYV